MLHALFQEEQWGLIGETQKVPLPLLGFREGKRNRRLKTQTAPLPPH